ncbi:hypothetical protein TNCV_148621 [Trichonephila clavipes]|nr:hypothetical protein TNCV_148621 [Trichonephila clavipes]
MVNGLTSEYEFEFQHVKGKNNLLADYISREKHGHADMPPDRILPALINALITQELSDEIQDKLRKMLMMIFKKLKALCKKKNIKSKKNTSLTTTLGY